MALRLPRLKMIETLEARKKALETALKFHEGRSKAYDAELDKQCKARVKALYDLLLKSPEEVSNVTISGYSNEISLTVKPSAKTKLKAHPAFLTVETPFPQVEADFDGVIHRMSKPDAQSRLDKITKALKLIRQSEDATVAISSRGIFGDLESLL